jgi:hypothetical protein
MLSKLPLHKTGGFIGGFLSPGLSVFIRFHLKA